MSHMESIFEESQDGVENIHDKNIKGAGEDEVYPIRKMSAAQSLPINSTSRKDTTGSAKRKNDRKNDKEKSKNSQKNKYISKLMNIAPQKMAKIDSYKNYKNQQEYQECDRKERGKLFAKRCRDRKKLYIQLMEQHHAKLQAEIQQTNKQIQMSRNQMQKIMSQNPTIGGFLDGRFQFIKKIYSFLKQHPDPPNQPAETDSDLNILIDSLRFRIGATGRERVNMINQYYKQLINLSLPALHRYLLWSAGEQSHYFGIQATSKDQLFQQLSKQVNLTPIQIIKMKQSQQNLKILRKQLTQLIKEVKRVKGEIFEKNLGLQQIVDEIREKLTATQAAHLILFTQKNKFRKQFNDQMENESLPLLKIQIQ